MAYVAKRTRREAGIRMALGARPARVGARAMAQGMLPAAAGLLAGTGLALLLSRVAAGRVEGLGPVDAPTVVAAAVLLAAVAGLAGWGPARRAARVDLTRVLQDG